MPGVASRLGNSAHHTVMTTTVPVDTREMFADMARTELLVTDEHTPCPGFAEHTTRRGFAEQIRANHAYFRLARAR